MSSSLPKLEANAFFQDSSVVLSHATEVGEIDLGDLDEHND
jgi:hypothetical protein